MEGTSVCTVYASTRRVICVDLIGHRLWYHPSTDTIVLYVPALQSNLCTHVARSCVYCSSACTVCACTVYACSRASYGSRVVNACVWVLAVLNSLRSPYSTRSDFTVVIYSSQQVKLQCCVFTYIERIVVTYAHIATTVWCLLNKYIHMCRVGVHNKSVIRIIKHMEVTVLCMIQHPRVILNMVCWQCLSHNIHMINTQHK